MERLMLCVSELAEAMEFARDAKNVEELQAHRARGWQAGGVLG